VPLQSVTELNDFNPMSDDPLGGLKRVFKADTGDCKKFADSDYLVIYVSLLWVVTSYFLSLGGDYNAQRPQDYCVCRPLPGL